MLNIRQIKRLKMLKMDMGWFEFSYFIVRVIVPGAFRAFVAGKPLRTVSGPIRKKTGTAKGLKSAF
jgi:hypothetical protein